MDYIRLSGCTIDGFVFNDTATTEIYKNRHSLSLHDALPIFLARAFGPAFFVPRPIQGKRYAGLRGGAAARRQACDPGRCGRQAPAPRATQHGKSAHHAAPCAKRGAEARSEEHTSELQSLMRISYAVFCLKKKTHKQNQTTH